MRFDLIHDHVEIPDEPDWPEWAGARVIKIQCCPHVTATLIYDFAEQKYRNPEDGSLWSVLHIIKHGGEVTVIAR